jgi:RNA polymerase sigma factor (sigma-70 family)
MRSRQSIIEVFSTFLQFDGDRASGWATDPKLRRSMLTCQSKQPQPETSENFWVIYWYKVWQKQPVGLAEAHLSAYLQEVCYWAVQKTLTSFSTVQYTLSDCFQMVIIRVNKILKGFKPDMGFNLANYASAVFNRELKEILRQQREVDICTNWKLLRKISRKQFVESLYNAGISQEKTASYVLAWKCFQTEFVPQVPSGGSPKLPQKPDEATWSAIASLYNSERLTQLNPPGPEATAESIEKSLTSCAKAVRTYLYPNFTSLNAPKGEQATGELIDNLPQLAQESLFTEIIAQEEEQNRRSQQEQINAALQASIAKLDKEGQAILQLYYTQGMTQQQIAQQLGIKQYTISRRLTKSREVLLKELAAWAKEQLHISLNSEVIKYINTIMEEWLQAYYSHLPSP